MGTYYRYVNFTRREFVSLTDLRDGGSKDNAVLYCGPALAWLISQPYLGDDGYHGRWRSFEPSAPAQDVRVVSDGAYDFYDMDEEGFLNITPGLLQSLRERWPALVADYRPRWHDVTLQTHRVERGSDYVPLDEVSASCRCNWRVGPLRGERREETLLQIVSDHVNGRRPGDEWRRRSPRPAVYRAELSIGDVGDLAEAVEVASGLATDPERARRLRALRDRLIGLPPTREASPDSPSEPEERGATT